MSEKEWDKLFELMGKAVNLDGMSADEKGQRIMEKAKSRDDDNTVVEFVSMIEDKLD